MPESAPAGDAANLMKNAILPPAMLFQSAGGDIAKSYAEAAGCSARAYRENVEELGRCAREILSARNPVDVAAGYGSFLLRAGQRNVERAAEIGAIMVRAGTSLVTAKPDGSLPPAADGASDQPVRSKQEPSREAA